jgi:outer membrane receptor protein involved in Fe transport
MLDTPGASIDRYTFLRKIACLVMFSVALGPFPVQANEIIPPSQESPKERHPATLVPIEVTSSRLKDARIDLSPTTGTTIYSIDSAAIQSLSQGENASFDEVLEHLPGVSKDSKASGSLHVRDDHGNVQYRINGVQLPESVSGFGLAIDSRFVESLQFLTGTLPAQYGLRTAGIVEIQTKEGSLHPGGSVNLELGNHQTQQLAVQGFGGNEENAYYFSASGLNTSEGIENPTTSQNAIHDDSSQKRFFGTFNWYLDDLSQISLLAGSYRGKYKIPNNPNQTAVFSLQGISNSSSGASSIASVSLNEMQYENNQFLIASFQQKLGTFDYQLSVFHQFSDVHYFPDSLGDLVFNGVASQNYRSHRANGLQEESTWKMHPNHTLRFGGAFTSQVTSSHNSTTAFPGSSAGQTSNVAISSPIIDDSTQLGQIASLYVQDEWTLDPALTLNIGIRYDNVNAFIHEHQFSPRTNLSYKYSDNTLFHIGFSRYFAPPPQELESQTAIHLYNGTTAASYVAYSDLVRAERTSYYDMGMAHQLSAAWVVAVDTYFKDINNVIDEGQFGQSLILSPFNYARGSVKGIELSTTYSQKNYSAYINLAIERSQASDIISGQSLFSSSELAYIASHNIYLDHDQRLTASLGASYRMNESTKCMVDGLYGSGLRRQGLNGSPNGDHLPAYVIVNLGATKEWKIGTRSTLEARVSLLNIFDRVYELRDGTGIGVGAPQFGLRRSVFGAATLKF